MLLCNLGRLCYETEEQLRRAKARIALTRALECRNGIAQAKNHPCWIRRKMLNRSSDIEVLGVAPDIRPLDFYTSVDDIYMYEQNGLDELSGHPSEQALLDKTWWQYLREADHGMRPKNKVHSEKNVLLFSYLLTFVFMVLLIVINWVSGCDDKAKCPPCVCNYNPVQ
jgi:hypothetical protein